MWKTNDISRVSGGVEGRGEGGRTNRIGKEFYSFEIPFETRKEMACLRNVTEKH